MTQSMPFRGIANVEDKGFLYDLHACVGGLVDTWTSVNEIHGHIETGMALRRDETTLEGCIAGDAVRIRKSQWGGVLLPSPIISQGCT